MFDSRYICTGCQVADGRCDQSPARVAMCEWEVQHPEEWEWEWESDLHPCGDEPEPEPEPEEGAEQPQPERECNDLFEEVAA